MMESVINPTSHPQSFYEDRGLVINKCDGLPTHFIPTKMPHCTPPDARYLQRALEMDRMRTAQLVKDVNLELHFHLLNMQFLGWPSFKPKWHHWVCEVNLDNRVFYFHDLDPRLRYAAVIPTPRVCSAAPAKPQPTPLFDKPRKVVHMKDHMNKQHIMSRKRAAADYPSSAKVSKRLCF